MADDKDEAPEAPLPGYTDARIQQVFDDLASMQVQLDADPLAYGPKRLNGKVAEARGMLTRCEQTFTQVSRDLLALQRRHRAAQTEFKIRMDDLFANDPETRAGRNVSDREALARTKLRAEVQEIARLENLIKDLETVMIVVKAKRADLRDIMGRLKDQMRLCTEETGLGARWGSQVPGARPLTPGIGAAQAGSGMEMAQVLSGVEGEVRLAAADGRFTDATTKKKDVDTGEEDKEALRALARKQAEEPEAEAAPVPAPATDPCPEVVTRAATLSRPTTPTALPVDDLFEEAPAPVQDKPCAEIVMGAPQPEKPVVGIPAPPQPPEPPQKESPPPEPMDLPEADAVALPGATATTTEVETFLSFGLETATPGQPAPNPQSGVAVQDEDLLDSLIDSFDKGSRAPR
jgi:hypothetical protein